MPLATFDYVDGGFLNTFDPYLQSDPLPVSGEVPRIQFVTTFNYDLPLHIVNRTLRASYNLLGLETRVQPAIFIMWYGKFAGQEIRRVLGMQWEIMPFTKSTMYMPYSATTVINPVFSLPYALTTPTRPDATVFKYSVLDYDPTNTNLVARYALQDLRVQSVSGSPEIRINGNIISNSAVKLSADENSPMYLGELVLLNTNQFSGVKLGDAVQVIFSGETFNLIVDGKNMSRQFGNTVQSLSCSSPIALFKEPFAQARDISYLTSTSANEVVEDMLGAVGWQLPDWYIPPAQLQFSNTTPLAVVTRVMEAIGGLVESNPDGTIVCRKKHKVPVPTFVGNIDLILTDSDLLSSSERVSPKSLFNNLILSTANLNEKDSLEYLEITPTSGTVRAYLSPVREVQLEHTSIPATSITAIGDEVRTEVETIEFINGMSSTQYPITAITSVEWNAVNLGAVTFSGSDLSSTVEGESLLNITYTVTTRSWSVSGAVDTTNQFVLRS